MRGPAKPINGPPRGYGRLRLTSKPSSRVFIDGKDRGHTPIYDLRLPEGPHDVELRYESDRARVERERFRVLIEPDKTWTTIRRNLR